MRAIHTHARYATWVHRPASRKEEEGRFAWKRRRRAKRRGGVGWAGIAGKGERGKRTAARVPREYNAEGTYRRF